MGWIGPSRGGVVGRAAVLAALLATLVLVAPGLGAAGFTPPATGWSAAGLQPRESLPRPAGTTYHFSGSLAEPQGALIDQLNVVGPSPTCGISKPFPGTQPALSQQRYNVHTYTNPTAAPVCLAVTYQLTSAVVDAQIFAAAYSPSFYPSDMSSYYLSDAGAAAAGGPVMAPLASPRRAVGTPVTFSFTVGASQTVDIVIYELTSGSSASYTLDLDDGLAGPPTATATATSTAIATASATATSTTIGTATATATTAPGSTTATATATTGPTTPTATGTPGTVGPTPTLSGQGAIGLLFGNGGTGGNGPVVVPADGSQTVVFKVTVTQNGQPAQGISVTFTAPPSGPSGTFDVVPITQAPAARGRAGQTSQSFGVSDQTGVATSPPFHPNGVAGQYTVTAETNSGGRLNIVVVNTTASAATPTPVIPELPPVWLFGSGLLALGWMGRRRRR